MRKLAISLVVALTVVLAGCVTINVYFPAAAAQQAAQKFIGHVIANPEAPAPASSAAQPAPDDSMPSSQPLSMVDWLIPAAHAAEPVDLKISTPRIEALRGRMTARYRASLMPLLASGAIGFTHDGLVALHDAGKVPLAKRNQVRALIDAENADRKEVYKAIAQANGHPEWAPKIRATFAAQWINMAHAGWYVQNAAGQWRRK